MVHKTNLKTIFDWNKIQTYPIFKRKAPDDFKYWFGSQWWCLNSTTAQWIIDYLNEHTEYEKFFEHSLCSDECFFQTLVMNSPFANTTKPYLHYIKWEKGKSSPRTLTTIDYEELKKTEKIIARKAAYPINAMGISKAMMEHVIYANARVAAERGGTTICCTRYGNVMCSRGSVIPLFIDQIKAGNPITITDPNMTRFLMNLDEAVDLVLFAFQHANPGDLFIQKSDASTIGDLAKAVQQLFGDTGTNIIGTRHGEKLFETLMTREERLRSQDMGHYFRVAADNRDLNYDKFVVKGEVHTMADESYTSHNTERLDVEGTVKKILTTEYVQNALKGIPNV